MPEAHVPKKSVRKFDCQREIAFLNLGGMGKQNLLKTRDKELHFPSLIFNYKDCRSSSMAMVL